MEPKDQRGSPAAVACFGAAVGVAVGLILGPPSEDLVGWGVAYYNLTERICQTNVSAKIRHEQEGCRDRGDSAPDSRRHTRAARRAGDRGYELGRHRASGRRRRRHGVQALSIA